MDVRHAAPRPTYCATVDRGTRAVLHTRRRSPSVRGSRPTKCASPRARARVVPCGPRRSAARTSPRDWRPNERDDESRGRVPGEHDEGVPRVVVAEHRAVGARARRVLVLGPRLGHVPHRPAGRAHPPGQVGVLVVEEEARVEPADLVEHLAAQQRPHRRRSRRRPGRCDSVPSGRRKSRSVPDPCAVTHVPGRVHEHGIGPGQQDPARWWRRRVVPGVVEGAPAACSTASGANVASLFSRTTWPAASCMPSAAPPAKPRLRGGPHHPHRRVPLGQQLGRAVRATRCRRRRRPARRARSAPASESRHAGSRWAPFQVTTTARTVAAGGTARV